MVVDSYSQGHLGAILSDDVVIQRGFYLFRFGALDRVLGLVFADDLVTKRDALVANKHLGPADQLLHLSLAFGAKRAGEILGTLSGLGHDIHFLGGVDPSNRLSILPAFSLR